MPRWFGTDGIRGIANDTLPVELVVKAGRCLARACREGLLGSYERPRVVVGRDTRVSGDMLEAALVAGLCSGGADAVLAGVIPTPGVAHLVAALGTQAGVALSASHNPVGDNGVKVFGPGGWKLSEDAEACLEALMDGPAAPGPTGTKVGRSESDPAALRRYRDHLSSSVQGSLDGLAVVVDCAHGAASALAEELLAGAGASVELLHAAGDGSRINQGCGATHPEVVAAEARRRGAIGLSLDGDADRLIAADENGRIVDGDQIIALMASRLGVDSLVVTVMSNQALRLWCADQGIELIDVGVGDRFVLAALRERNLVLGGEQSGHIVRLDLSTTGDGLLTALGLLAAVRDSGKRLADIVPFRPMPQVLVNVETPRAGELDDAKKVWDAVRRVESSFSGTGRLLVRASGTEPLVRVMAEAPTAERARAAAEQIAAVVTQQLGA